MSNIENAAAVTAAAAHDLTSSFPSSYYSPTNTTTPHPHPHPQPHPSFLIPHLLNLCSIALHLHPHFFFNSPTWRSLKHLNLLLHIVLIFDHTRHQNYFNLEHVSVQITTSFSSKAQRDVCDLRSTRSMRTDLQNQLFNFSSHFFYKFLFTQDEVFILRHWSISRNTYHTKKRLQ